MAAKSERAIKNSLRAKAKWWKNNYSSDHNTTKLRTAQKMRDIDINAVYAGANNDISKCTDLIGKWVEVMVVTDTVDTKKAAVITKLYPHNALAIYRGGKDNEHEFRICLSVADLVEKGVLTFEKGYPEVKNE